MVPIGPSQRVSTSALFERISVDTKDFCAAMKVHYDGELPPLGAKH